MTSLGSSSGNDLLFSTLDDILNGKEVDTKVFLASLEKSTSLLEQGRLLKKVTGDAIVIGPCRGHAADLAHYLRKNVLVNANESKISIVFLGNYVDGGHQSVEVLYILSLMVQFLPCVVPLIGQHELFYPFHPCGFGSLRGELRIRSLHAGMQLESLEKTVTNFFRKLPIACVINDRFFCSAGGIASGYHLLKDIAKETSQEKLSEFVRNQPMDEDEDRMAAGCGFVGFQTKDGKCLKYTFNALCNFISRNNLLTHIGGMEYRMHRPEFESCTRYSHYKESTYFPGYVFGRTHYDLRAPTYILLFSAPHFCGVNQNSGCALAICGDTLELRQFEAYPFRPVIMPGEEGHAFSWSQPVLEKALTSILKDILHGAIEEIEQDNVLVDEKFMESRKNATTKFRRLCQLLKTHSLSISP